jgi:hypothetical protein
MDGAHSVTGSFWCDAGEIARSLGIHRSRSVILSDARGKRTKPSASRRRGPRKSRFWISGVGSTPRMLVVEMLMQAFSRKDLKIRSESFTESR